MKLADLVANYKPVYPEPYTWDSTLAYVQADPIENKILSILLEDLQKNGKFREPVRLGFAEFEDDVETPCVSNGTHRVCAHILYGSEDVDTFEEKPYSGEYDDVEDFLTTTVILKGDLTDDEYDSLFGILRSFPLTEEIWLTSGIGSSTRKETVVLSTTWDIEDYSSVNYSDVNAKVKEILNDFGFADKIIEVKTEIEHYGED